MTDQRSVYSRLTKWLRELQSSQDWSRHDEAVRAFRTIATVLTTDPEITDDFTALLQEAEDSGEWAGVLGAFSDEEKAEARPSLPAPEIGRKVADEVRRLAGSGDDIYRESGPLISYSLGLRRKLEKAFNSQVHAERPYAEAAALMVYQAYFDVIGLEPIILSGNPNHYPYTYASLLKIAESICEALAGRQTSLDGAGASMNRFRVYCEWFGRERIGEMLGNYSASYLTALSQWKTAQPEGRGRRPRFDGERLVHSFLNEYFFQRGYFPLVNFSIAGDEPDTLLVQQLTPAAGVPLAIEVKQLLKPELDEGVASATGGSPPTEAFVRSAFAQTVRYLEQLSAVSRVPIRNGALCIFYGGPKPLAALRPMFKGVAGYSITLTAIYLGPGGASDALPPLDVKLD